MVDLAIALRDAPSKSSAFVDVNGVRANHAQIREAAARVATLCHQREVGPASVVALVAENSLSFVIGWLGALFSGAEVALINATYPLKLIGSLTRIVDADVVMSDGSVDNRALAEATGRAVWNIDGLERGSCWIGNQAVELPDGASGADALVERSSQDIAGYMHTSGSTGWPKFCAQSHAYYLNLAEYCQDVLHMTAESVVYNPLPLYHINPLGYGLVPALLSGASYVTDSRFSARQYWSRVQKSSASILILHQPLVRILKQYSDPLSMSHEVEVAFLADAEFLRRFHIPEGIGAYGSTEAGGLTSHSRWQLGDLPDVGPPEGISCVAGECRQDMSLEIADDGEILVAETVPGHLASYYLTESGSEAIVSDDGFFRTGDVARIDERFGPVFVGRREESIRINGEFVPIPFVEAHFEDFEHVSEAAITLETEGGYEALVLYVVASRLPPVSALEERQAVLPRYMRPSLVRRVSDFPRVSGIGKVRRGGLGELEVLEERVLNTKGNLSC